MKDLVKDFLKRPILWGLGVAAAAFVGVLFYTDPDRGESTQSMLLNLISGGLAFTMASLIIKVTFDKLHFSTHAKKAEEGSLASAIIVAVYVLAVCFAALIFSPRAHAQDVQTYVPAGAYKYCPMLQAEKNKLWPAHIAPAALCSLVELESCVHLKHPKCWNQNARLKTDREEGASFGQITRAYHADGSIRFDALSAAKQLDPSLQDWSWDNVYQRPELALRAIVLMNRDCVNRLSRMVKDAKQVYRMCDAAYNGGYAGMQSERRACGLRTGCDPQIWDGHVENVCLKSKTKWRGYGKSACEINREHVFNVFDVRYQKYVRFAQVKT
jgi:hypothetical protein